VQHTVTSGISSRSFSSLPIALRRHVPWMCPEGSQLVTPRYELPPGQGHGADSLDVYARKRTAPKRAAKEIICVRSARYLITHQCAGMDSTHIPI